MLGMVAQTEACLLSIQVVPSWKDPMSLEDLVM